MRRKTQRRQTILLNEKLELEDFKPDGSQTVRVMGVSAATIPNSNVKEGDIIKVDMVLYGGKPRGRYRKFDLESIRDFRRQNPMRGIPGVLPGPEAELRPPGTFQYVGKTMQFGSEIESIGGESFLLTPEELEQVGIKVDPELLSGEPMQENKG